MGEFVGLQMENKEAVADEYEEEIIEQEEEAEPDEEVEGEADESSEDDEIIVTIGDDTPASEEEEKQPAPEWVKELRKTSREDKRRIRELEEKLTAKVAAETKPAELGKKPTLDDYDYDAEKFEKGLEDWFDRKRAVDAEQSRQEQARKAEQDAWNATLEGYNKAKSSLKVRDFEEAEHAVQESLNVVQQGIILQGGTRPELIVYALYKTPAKMKELAAIKDPVKFAFAVADLQRELKVTNRKAPPPEGKATGSAAISGTVSGSALERLKAKAQQTGDWTAYYDAKRKTNSK